MTGPEKRLLILLADAVLRLDTDVELLGSDSEGRSGLGISSEERMEISDLVNDMRERK